MFSHLLAFETNFDSYSYDSYDFHFDSYYLFHSTNVVYYLSCHPSTKFSSDLIKDQFRESRKYLEPFYTWQPNQLQTNNVTKGGEEGEAMHVHDDYQNHPYQPSAPTSDQQQQIKETWHWWRKKEFTNMNIWTPLNDLKNHSYHPKTASIAQ